VGEALLVLDGRLPTEPEPRPISVPPDRVAAYLRDLPPAHDWWWNWEERCLRSCLLYALSPSAWVADELRDQLRRVLRLNPENEAIEIGADPNGQPLARFRIPRVGAWCCKRRPSVMNIPASAAGRSTVRLSPVSRTSVGPSSSGSSS